MNETLTNKSQIKSWLFRLLSEIEICNDADGTLVEKDGNKTILTIQFKS